MKRPSRLELVHAQKLLEYCTRMLADARIQVGLELPSGHPVVDAATEATQKVAILVRTLHDAVRRLPD